MRGAVVVASLLSQLSQQCGGALVRVRDEVSRSTPSDEWLPDAQSFSVCREASASHSALGQAPVLSPPDVRGGSEESFAHTDTSRPSHRGAAAAETREKQIPILGGARAKP